MTTAVASDPIIELQSAKPEWANRFGSREVSERISPAAAYEIRAACQAGLAEIDLRRRQREDLQYMLHFGLARDFLNETRIQLDLKRLSLIEAIGRDGAARFEGKRVTVEAVSEFHVLVRWGVQQTWVPWPSVELPFPSHDN